MNKSIPATVRRSIQKGTHTVQEPLITSAWSGQTFRNQEDERLVQAGNMMITTAKGTSRKNRGSRIGYQGSCPVQLAKCSGAGISSLAEQKSGRRYR